MGEWENTPEPQPTDFFLYNERSFVTMMTDTISYDDLFDYVNNILRSPYNTLVGVRESVERYMEKRALAYGVRAVRYDNPLGCKVQTSGGRTEADMIDDTVDYEQVIFYNRMTHFHSESVLRTIIDNAGLTYRERRIIELRHLCYPCYSYDTIAPLIGYSTGSGVFKTYKKAITKIADFILKYDYYYEIFPS